jgi:endonuclease YncB( thermonuclease family)
MNRCILHIFFILVFFTSSYSYAKTIIGKPKIIDGDTVHINKNKIRLHAIDAPETKQSCLIDLKKWSCGKQSTAELKKMISNRIIRCEVNDIDIYNRYVGVCYINTIDINKWMVKNGWAIAYKYYSIDYINEEKFARENKLGIWNSEFLEPYLYRKKNKN